MAKQKIKVFCGIQSGRVKEIFTGIAKGSERDYGYRFDSVMGPFRTYRAAVFVRNFLNENPGAKISVTKAEKLSRVA